MRLRVLAVAGLTLLAGCGTPDHAAPVSAAPPAVPVSTAPPAVPVSSAPSAVAVSAAPSTFALDGAVDNAMTSVSAQWDTAGRQACDLAQHEVFGGQVLDPAVPPKIVKAARRSGSAVLRHEADHLAAVLKTGTEGERVSALTYFATLCINGS